jgi:hypothetical protein
MLLKCHGSVAMTTTTPIFIHLESACLNNPATGCFCALDFKGNHVNGRPEERELCMTPKYKLIHGDGRTINAELEAEAKDGWVPILFSSNVSGPPAAPVVTFSLVLEQRPVEAWKRDVQTT